MLTGNHDEQLVRTCLKAGANDFIFEPYQRAVLVRKLTDVLRESLLGAT
jgi:FixJ family two-component response regulator